MPECCILINFSPFQDHGYYCKNTDNTEHMWKTHSQLWLRRPGDVLSRMSPGVTRSQWGGGAPQCPLGLQHLFQHVTVCPLLLSPAKPLANPAPPHPIETARKGGVAAFGNPRLIILLAKGNNNFFKKKRKGTFSHFRRMPHNRPVQSVNSSLAAASPEL